MSVTDRMKSPSFKRKMAVSQSISAPSSTTSDPPTTEPCKSAPPLPPMSSHPVLLRRLTAEAIPPKQHQHDHYKKTHVRNPSLSSQHINEESLNDPVALTSSSQAPPLPPKPKDSHPYVPFIPMLQRPESSDYMNEHEIEYSHIKSKGTCLSELTKSQQCKFPMQVMVTNGAQGTLRQNTIPNGEVLNLLCLKERKLVIVETLTGAKVKVPMNSSLQFGILYDPTNNVEQAVKGFLFKTAGDVLNLSALPKIICATKQHRAGKEKHAVQKWEILLVKETLSRGHSKRALSCIQLESGKRKKLFENCAGQFTTQPESVKMFLPEITNHIGLPQMAVVFFPEKQTKVDFSDEREIPLAHQEVIKITEVVSEKSILAVYSSSSIAAPPDRNRGSSNTLLDIPEDHPTLKVQLLQTSPSEQESIAKLSRWLTQGPTTKIQHHVRIGNDASMFDFVLLPESSDSQQRIVPSEVIPSLTQKKLSSSSLQNSQIASQNASSTSLDTDASSVSVEAYACFDAKKLTITEALSEDEGEGEQEEEYVQMKPDLQPRISESPSLSAFVDEVVEKKLQELDNAKQKEIESLRGEIAKLQFTVEDLRKQCKEINNQQAAYYESLRDVRALAEENKLILEHSLRSSSESHKETTSNVSQQAESSSQSHVETTSDVSQQVESESKQQRCHRKLEAMSCEQVLQLLDRMNLGKYKESFHQEQIDGSLLLSCDSEILECELGITSRLHRVKMLRLIEGDVPEGLFNDL